MCQPAVPPALTAASPLGAQEHLGSAGTPASAACLSHMPGLGVSRTLPAAPARTSPSLGRLRRLPSPLRRVSLTLASHPQASLASYPLPPCQDNGAPVPTTLSERHLQLGGGRERKVALLGSPALPPHTVTLPPSAHPLFWPLYVLPIRYIQSTPTLGRATPPPTSFQDTGVRLLLGVPDYS